MRGGLIVVSLVLLLIPSALAAPVVHNVEWTIADADSSRSVENHLTFVTEGDVSGWVARVSVAGTSGTRSLVIDHPAANHSTAAREMTWRVPFDVPRGRHVVAAHLVAPPGAADAALLVDSREVHQGHAPFVGAGWGLTASAVLDAVDVTGDGSADVILQTANTSWSLRVSDEAWAAENTHGWRMTFALTRTNLTERVVEFRVMGDTLRDVLHVDDPRTIRLLTPGVSMATRPTGELYMHVEPAHGQSSVNVTLESVFEGSAPVEPWRPGQAVRHAGPEWDVDGDGAWDARFWRVDSATALATAHEPAMISESARRQMPVNVTLAGNLSNWGAGQRLDIRIEDLEVDNPGMWIEVRRDGFIRRMVQGATEVPFVIDSGDNAHVSLVPGTPGSTWVWTAAGNATSITLATAPWRASAATAAGSAPSHSGLRAADDAESDAPVKGERQQTPLPAVGPTLVALGILAAARRKQSGEPPPKQ